MFKKLSECLRKVILAARDEAKRLNHAEIGTEHFLLALTLEEDGVFCALLHELGIDPDRIRGEVEKLVQRGTKNPVSDLPFTQGSKRVLQLAREEADTLGHDYIGTEHLLLGLLKEGEGIAYRVLSNAGMNVEKLRDCVKEFPRQAIQFSEPKKQEPIIHEMEDSPLKKCRKVVIERAIDAATRILTQRRMTFRAAETPQEAKAITEGAVKRMIAEEDALGAAACLMQNHRFLIGQDRADELARVWSRLMCKLGDEYFYGGAGADEGLRCYQLAVGLDPWNLEGLIGVGAVCLQGEKMRPEEALPYVILQSNLKPERNDFPYVVSLMMQGMGDIRDVLESQGERSDSGEDLPWPTAGGNARRTGELKKEVKPPFSVVWTFKCGGVNSHIVVSGNTTVFGNRAGYVFAVDVRNGKKLWMYRLDGIVTGSPAIQAGRVYVGNSAIAVCLNLETGKPVWKSETGAKVLEELSERGPHIASLNSVLCVRGLAVFCDDFLAVFDAATGKLITGMHIYLDAGYSAGPCANNEYIFVPGYKKILRVSLSSGEIEEPVPTQGKVISGPVLAGGVLLHGSNRASMEAISLDNWEPAWSFQVEGEVQHLGWVDSRPAFSSGRVYFGGPDGFVYALDARNGKKIWSQPLGGDIVSPPLVSGKTVFVSAPEQSLCALSAEDGRLLWKIEQRKLGLSTSCFLAPWADGLLAGGHALYGLKAG